MSPGLLLFVGSFGLLLFGLRPGAPLDAGGALAASSFSLGAAAGPMWPVAMLLERLVLLLPVGEVATRAALVSALATAATAVVIYRTAAALAVAALAGSAGTATTPRDGTGGPRLLDRAARGVDGGSAAEAASTIGGLVAVALFVSGDAVWRGAGRPGPEALGLLVFVVATSLLLTAARGGSSAQSAGLGLWLCLGLGIGVDAPICAILSLPAMVVTALRLRRGERWPLLAPICFSVGVCALLALPLLAARPASRGADPRTLGALLQQARSSLLAPAAPTFFDAHGSPDLRGGSAPGLAGTLFALERQVGLPSLLLAALGLAMLGRRAISSALVLSLLLVSAVAAAVWLQLDPPAARPVMPLLVAVLAGLGVAAFSSLAGFGEGGTTPAPAASDAAAEPRGARGDRPGVLAVCARGAAVGAIALVPLFVGEHGSFSASGRGASAWIRAALEEAPPRALVLLGGPGLDGGMAYERVVAGRRPDLTVLRRDRLSDDNALARAVALGGAMALSPAELQSWSLRPPSSRALSGSEMLSRLIAANLGARAVLWEPMWSGSSGSSVPSLSSVTPPLGMLAPDVPLFRLEAREEAAPLPAAVPLVEKISSILARPRDVDRGADRHPGPGPDPEDRHLEGRMLSSLADLYATRGDDARARWLDELARAACPREAGPVLGLARALSRRGHPEEALALALGLLRANQDDPALLVEVGGLRLRLGDVDAADRDFRRARERAPLWPGPIVGLARAAHARGDDAESARLVDEALGRSPDDPDARALADDLGLQ